ncbi:unnamed protein product [Ixodes pacificus]
MSGLPVPGALGSRKIHKAVRMARRNAMSPALKKVEKPVTAEGEGEPRDDLSFLTRGRHTDVEFLVERGFDNSPRSFRAHKMVLAMRNEVFEAMFYGNLPEGDQVRITDLEPDGFSTFLRYLYSQQVTFVDMKQALHTRTAAQKYIEPKLVEACDTFIQKAMQPADVCNVLDYATKHGSLTKFDSVIDRLVEENAGQVLESSAFVSTSRDVVIRILKHPRLCINEYDVIESVYAWAIAHCAQGTDESYAAALREIMRPFLPELRFLTLTSVEFVEGPLSWHILTEGEALAVLSNIVKPGSKKLPENICASVVERTA